MGRITETVKVLLIINVLFFIGTQLLGETAYRLFSLWFFENENFGIWQIITHMFMHGSFMHILFNMYALWAFGSPIEQMLGQKKFIFFYVMTLPFGYVFQLGYYVVPVVVFIFYVLASLELIAEEIEDPFGNDPNDLPTQKIAENIKKNIEELIY